MKKTVGIFAHVDAGKTTFSEQILFKTESIRTVGRVDNKNTFLDSHEVEKRRGITIFSDQAEFSLNDNKYYLIDTPGHVDFSSEMERAISILDYAVIIISGIDGIESHTETVYELLEEANIPVFFFINKMDQGHADIDSVMDELKNSLCKNAVDFSDKNFIENISAYDDDLLEKYFEDEYEENLWTTTIKKLIKTRNVMPVYYGSALKNIGIDKFISDFDKYTVTEYKGDNVSGKVYKIKYDEKGVKNTYIKLLSGKLNTRDVIKDEKITQIRLHNGTKHKTCDSVSAGEVFSIVGPKELHVGDVFGDDVTETNYNMHASLKSKVTFNDSINTKEVLKDIRVLEDEDPSLNVTYIEQSKEIHIGIMGVIQIEILTEIIKTRFGYEVMFEEPTIIYKETIKDEVMGCGHFEPLKHYAEVILNIKSGKEGSGITFINKCSADHLSTGNQNLVKHHLFETPHRGILTGSDLTDLEITLLTGRGHNMYTSGGDFREATKRAIRHGLEFAKNILLEPIYTAKITIPMDLMGRVMTDITKASGISEAPIQLGDKILIVAKVPVKSFMNYSTELAGFSGGKGRISLAVSEYKPCHNQDQVIEEIAYDKEVDLAYSSSSVFCKQGKGYTIKWQESKSYMHCLK